MKVSELRCSTYKELSDKIKKATDRCKERGALEHQQMISRLITSLSNDDCDGMLRDAVSLGFDPKWLVKKEVGKKRSAAERMLELAGSQSSGFFFVRYYRSKF